MKAGDHVWLRSGHNQHLADVRGIAIAFRITTVETLPGHGTWYQLRTWHPAAQEIFGGWHPGLSLTPIPLSKLTNGTYP